MVKTHLRRGQPCRPEQIQAFRPVSAELIHSRYPLMRTDPKRLKSTGPYIPYARVLYMLLCGGGPRRRGDDAEDDAFVALGVYSRMSPPYNPPHR